MQRVLVSGFFLFAIVYAGVAFATTLPVFLALFCLYGLYAAATEGVAKAWITNICDKKDTATAIGTYTAFQSLGSLGASSMAGFIWYAAGPGPTFALSAGVAGIVAVYLGWFFKSNN